jgi:alginate O-acetyltransferase complex protein AlgI
MLFNSYIFLAGFLPAVLLVFVAANYFSKRGALATVTLASLVFYGYWDVRFVPLICGSIAINYVIGHAIGAYRRRWILIVGVAANLLIIGFFKYSLFLFQNIAPSVPPPALLQSLILPLGISFWTFQQIAYLVDVHRRTVEPAPLDAHAFSMLFFPHLIAGPILRYAIVSRQYLRSRWPAGFLFKSFQVGVLIFAIGLFKKVVIADSLASFAEAAFKRAAVDTISPSDAWIGSISYSLQLYFDFSGYSDMAFGLARMFGIRIPVNFFSPYKARSILDFWRRWHMSLTSFFRFYVYLPLGGNRRGAGRQILNILTVFFLTGVWHGAGWTFFLWGLGHGILVAAAHSWRRFAAPVLYTIKSPWLRLYLTWVSPMLSRLATLLAVHCLWVLFRSPDFDSASRVFAGMLHQTHPWSSVVYPELGLYKMAPLLLAAVGLGALLLPNTFEISRYVRRLSSVASGRSWAKVAAPPFLVAFFLYFAVTSIARQQSTFLYYNF